MVDNAPAAGVPAGRTFAAPGRGGLGLHPGRTAVLFIEFQNEFTTQGGKLHGSVRECMSETGMLDNAARLVREVRALAADKDQQVAPVEGLTATGTALQSQSPPVFLFHAPISFNTEGSDNPNRYLGILGGCDSDKLFVRGTWGAELCPPLRPEGWTERDWAQWGSEQVSDDCKATTCVDVLVKGKRGLSAFPGTDLLEKLKARGVETIALAGFMANCCVESTMREACERGFNVITLADCVATTSMAGYKACTNITYPFFSTPMTSVSFLAAIRCALEEDHKAVESASAVEISRECDGCCRPAKRWKQVTSDWAFSQVAPDVFQAGPWFVDVRQSVLAEKLVLRPGEHELRRYLVFAAAASAPPEVTATDGPCQNWNKDWVYAKKLTRYGLDTDPVKTEPFGWLCNMTVVRLPEARGGGCLVYSPVLGPGDSMERVEEELKRHSLLPVRYVVAPSPQHHLALKPWQQAFPDASFLCGAASGQMPPLTRKRRDIRFAGVLSASAEANPGPNGSAGAGRGHSVVIMSPMPDREKDGVGGERYAAMLQELRSTFELAVLDDNRSGEVVLLHRASGTLILSDALYKSTSEVVGPGGTTPKCNAETGVLEQPPQEQHAYSTPVWFAQGQEELFYGRSTDNSGGLLPSYRTHPRMRTIDVEGMRCSLEHVLKWDIHRAVCCHTDPIDGGEQVRRTLRTAWGWLWEL